MDFIIARPFPRPFSLVLLGQIERERGESLAKKERKKKEKRKKRGGKKKKDQGAKLEFKVSFFCFLGFEVSVAKLSFNLLPNLLLSMLV